MTALCAPEERSLDPAGLVRAHVDAYNRHDVESLMALFARGARIVDRDGAIIDEGRPAIAVGFRRLFASMPSLHADVVETIHVGEWIAAHTTVQGWTVGRARSTDWLVLYRVAGGRIVELRLLY